MTESRIYFDPPVDGGRTFAKKPDEAVGDALGKVAQIIPGEVLGAYGAALGVLPLFDQSQRPLVGMICFVLGMVATAWFVGWQIKGKLKKQRHLLAYVGAFAVWAYSLSGQSALPGIYHPGVAALLPIGWGLVLYKIKLPPVEKR